MLQGAQEQDCLHSGTQFLMTGVEDNVLTNEDNDTAWQFMQDHRSAQCHHGNIPMSWILLDRQSMLDMFINK